MRGRMKKILGCLLGLTLLTGCAESLALLGPTSTAVTGGKITQSAFSTAVNYGVKKQTGKSAMEHMMTYAEEMSPQKKKELFFFLRTHFLSICHHMFHRTFTSLFFYSIIYCCRKS